MNYKTAISVAETFRSVQGEGPTMGVPSVFLRTSFCNLECHWDSGGQCDTIEVWKKVWRWMEPEEIVSYFDSQGWLDDLEEGNHLILTGGEPVIQQERLFVLVTLLNVTLGKRIYVEIETAGTLMPGKDFARSITQVNLSPKLNTSGNPLKKRYKLEVLEQFAALTAQGVKVAWKFVIASVKDMEEIVNYYYYPLNLSMTDIWLMPEACDRQTLIEKSAWVMEMCKGYGCNFSSRLHLIGWDRATGV